MNLTSYFDNLRLKHKLVVMVLPLVLVPVILVGGVIGLVASRQAFNGMSQLASDDLEHMTYFTTDLLNSHYRQFEVYHEDKKKTVRTDLATLLNLSISIVETQNSEIEKGVLSRTDAQSLAKEAIKKISVGNSGYAYAMKSDGTLAVHIASEGKNIINERDESGRFFIQEMIKSAVASPNEVQHIVYPWKNSILGDKKAREKTVAYRYYKPWDWIIAVGSYLDETYEDKEFELQSLADLKKRISAKKVGQTGYIYALDKKGVAVIHPFREGDNLYNELDGNGNHFIQEMLQKKSGWIRYPWKNAPDVQPRMKIVRYEYFEPWDWVIAVGSYENEFYAEAESMRNMVISVTVITTLVAGLVSTFLLFFASKVFTNPIERMTASIRKVKGGQLNERIDLNRKDELGELATAYNKMIGVLKNHRKLEQEIAHEGKMASLGVLSSTVAHEINNPLGIIMGYAAYLEKKLDPSDPNYNYISNILKESKRSKKIVQDLLSYAKTPEPDFEEVDVNDLLREIIEFSTHHPDMRGIKVETWLSPNIPKIRADGDQLRQVAINIILNAGAAMKGEGKLTVNTTCEDGKNVRIIFTDTGPGMDEQVKEQIFEPFFTTRTRGTGLGLAITRQIIKRHRGRIDVETQLGKGTSMIVELPVTHEEF